MQTICFDDYELHSNSAFNYITNKMIEMVNKENATVNDLSGYHWIIGDKVAGHIFPERPNKILDYDVVYEDPSIFYNYGINFEESKLRATGFDRCVLDRSIKIVRCENEDFDKEKSLAMAIVKKFFGTNKNKTDYYDIFKKWIQEEKKVENIKESVKETVYMSVKQYANMTGMSKSTIIRQINSGKIFGAKKDETGKWLIPVGEV